MLVLRTDYRSANIPRYYMADEEELFMFVPEEIKKCVVFVGCNTKDGLSFRGTAFLVGVPTSYNIKLYHSYLVTAKHVIDKIQTYSCDGKVILRVNNRRNSLVTIKTPINQWLFHPTEQANVDIAVLPFNFEESEFDCLVIPDSHGVTEESIKKEAIGIGDEVFMTGLFTKHQGRQRNLPIVRAGNIALMPDEKVYTQGFGDVDAYLVEARSIGGHSGSPVFVSTGTKRQAIVQLGQRAFYWLGLMHGHWNLPADKMDAIIDDDKMIEQVNMGIAIVVPASKVLEVVNQESFMSDRKKLEEKLNKKDAPVEDFGSEEY